MCVVCVTVSGSSGMTHAIRACKVSTHTSMYLHSGEEQMVVWSDPAAPTLLQTSL